MFAPYALTLALAITPHGTVHDPGLSLVEVRLEDDRLTAHLTFARLDVERLVRIDADRDGSISRAEFELARPRLTALAERSLELTVNGAVRPPSEVALQLDESDALHVRLAFRPAAGGGLRLRAPVVGELARGHRQYLSIRDARGKIVAECVLSGATDAVEVPDRAAPASTRTGTFRRFVGLGIEHILAGYDHLAFLLGLLLAGSGFRTMLKIITSFTIAHSITLALATLDLVSIPPGLVEPLIAASIVYVGLENLYHRDPGGRWLLTFAFGLVHGFGFASVLGQLGIEAGVEAAAPLFSFNLGVEIGQVAITGLVLPLIWQLARRPSLALPVAHACSLLIALAGGYWLVQRTLLA